MKTINGFSKYQISEDGIVVGPRGHAIAPHINKGMLAVKIHNDAGNRIAVQIHRAVAVDHIIPLQGKTVCGLHVENNLRAIPHFLNTRKGNKFEGV